MTPGSLPSAYKKPGAIGAAIVGLARHLDALLRHPEGAPRAAERRGREAGAEARFGFDWERQFELSVDPETARRMHDETLADDYFKAAELCSERLERTVEGRTALATSSASPSASPARSRRPRSGT
jgi:thiamine biosynthesis protein ThiC